MMVGSINAKRVNFSKFAEYPPSARDHHEVQVEVSGDLHAVIKTAEQPLALIRANAEPVFFSSFFNNQPIFKGKRI